MIRKVISVFGVLLYLLLPLSLFFFELPLKPEVNKPEYLYITIALLYAGVILIFAGKFLVKLIEHARWSTLGSATVIVVIFVALLLGPKLGFRPPFLVSAALMAFLCFFWGVLSKSASIPAPGILSLLVFLSGFVLTEYMLDEVPAEMLVVQVAKVPPLAPIDRGNQLFRKNGFRGKRPCVDCAERGIRVFTMGGSSTFGTPMYYSNDSYTARFEKMVKTLRPGEKWEIYNAGIPGYGIMQIQDSIEKELSKFKPDVVTVCAWFNDHSSIPGWYGFAGKSDKEAHEFVDMLRHVEKSSVYGKLSGLRLYAVFRYWALKLQTLYPESGMGKRPRRRPRMSPEEFKWGIDRIVELSKEHGFTPVLITEATNHVPSLEKAIVDNKYYQVMLAASKEHDIPFINVLDDFAEHKMEWTFYDFIHPNQAGHQIIAERMYESFFGLGSHPKLRDLMLQKNINLTRPRMRSEFDFQMARSQMPGGKIAFEARLNTADFEQYVLEMSINGETTLIQTGLTQEFTPFTFQLDPVALSKPIADITVAAKNINEMEAAETGRSRPKRLNLELRGIRGE